MMSPKVTALATLLILALGTGAVLLPARFADWVDGRASAITEKSLSPIMVELQYHGFQLTHLIQLVKEIRDREIAHGTATHSD